MENSPTLEEFRNVYKQYCSGLTEREEILALGDQIATRLYSEVVTNGGY